MGTDDKSAADSYSCSTVRNRTLRTLQVRPNTLVRGSRGVQKKNQYFLGSGKPSPPNIIECQYSQFTTLVYYWGSGKKLILPIFFSTIKPYGDTATIEYNGFGIFLSSVSCSCQFPTNHLLMRVKFSDQRIVFNFQEPQIMP